MKGVVLAAGVMPWRETKRGLEVLLVERTQYRDLSLPKGKLDPGETLPGCAVRELHEETGVRATLGVALGTSSYRLPNGRDKVVYYWQAEVASDADHTGFVPNDEIAALHWMPVREARSEVTYAHDVEIINRFLAGAKAGQLRTFPVIALRHGKAVDPFAWDGPDETRTLTHRGREQARMIASGLAAFGIERIQSSPADRCRETVGPLASLTGLEVRPKRGLGQDDFMARGGGAGARVDAAIQAGRGTVLCSHAPVVPRIVQAIAERTDAEHPESLRRSAMLHTAEFSVYHLTRGEEPRLAAHETHGAPDAESSRS